MTKASHLYCLILLLVVAAPAFKAQSQPADATSTATDEAVRRQANKIMLDNNLQAAAHAYQQGELLKAAQLYEDCYNRVHDIGEVAVPAENQAAVSGLISVLFDLAHRSAAQKDYRKADERYARILVVDPGNTTAMAERRENKRLLDLQAGTIPSQALIEQIPSWRTNEVMTATMVQDGKLLYEAGRLDEAEAKLTEALQRDPSDVAADHYLRLVKERRMADATRRTELHSGEALIQVEQAWDVEARNGRLDARPNIFNRTNLVYTSKGRQAITSKLDRIHVDKIAYDSLPLSAVIGNLATIARNRDPEKTGINFFIGHEAATALGGTAAGAIDPATGLPVAPLPTDSGADAGSATIKIDPELNDVRLADVLDAIVRTSDKPIRYSILDYAVEFTLRNPEPVPLEIRTFHVDPNTFRQGLEGVGSTSFASVQLQTSGGSGSSGSSGSSGGQGGQTQQGATLPTVNVAASGTTGGTGGGGQTGGSTTGSGIAYVTSRSNSLDSLQVSIRLFFNSIGLDFNTNKVENLGKAFAWNDRKGVLTVRSTTQDLDMIAAVVETLNQPPPEINIKAKFAEITQDDNRALGFNWTVGNFNIGSSLVGSGGTQSSFNGVPTSANPLGFFPGTATSGNAALGILPANTLTAPSTTDGVLAGVGGLSNPLNAPTIATLTGILTQPQFQVAIQALEQRGGVDLMTAPEITTESGRQAQIQAVDIQAIVTGNSASTSSSGGFAGVQSGVNSPIVNQPVLVNPTPTLLPFGPVLDVIPYVSADEFSVQMTIIPTVTEFIGYDPPGQFVIQAQQAAGSAPITAQLPLPHFRVRQVTTSVTVWDAQTLVMGGLITDSVTKEKDKVPFLGDMPLLGRLFRSESSSKTKKNLMIFVTPTIVNPDGTRYHSDEEMPFLQNQSLAKPVN